MAKPIAIACSDTHIDNHAWADRKEISGDSQYAFEQICNYAIRNKLPIIAAGDILDTKRNDALPIGFLVQQFNKLCREGVPFIYTQGQHELQPCLPWCSAIHDWPTWLSDLPNGYEIGGLTFYGIDWTPADQLQAKLDDVVDTTDVLVMHQVCHEFMGGIAPAELHLETVPCARMLLVGDYHEHRVAEVRGAQGQPLTVLSAGATHARKIDEQPPYKFFVIYDDLTYKSVRLRSRPYLEKGIFSDGFLDSFVEDIAGELEKTIAAYGAPPHLQKPLLRVKYAIDIPNAYARIVQAVGKQAHLFLKELIPKAEGAEFVEGTETYEEVEGLGLIGCLPLLVDEAEEPEVYNICRRLLSVTDDPQLTLAAIRDEHFNQELTDGLDEPADSV